MGFFRAGFGCSERTQYFETCRSKIRVHPRTDHEVPKGEYRYSFTLSLTSAVDGGGWLTLHPGHFTPWNDRVAIVRDGGWAPGTFWAGAENVAPHGIRSPNRPPRSESLYRLSYPEPTLSEDMCSNVLFICIRIRIIPIPKCKDAVPHGFDVNDHEIELWRSHHYMCTYCKKSVLILLFENERWRGLAL